MKDQNQKNDKILSCSHCGSLRLRENSATAELICQECGTVVEEDRVRESAERRAFTAEEKEEKKRTGSPITFTKPGRGMKTEIGSGYGNMSQASPEKRSQYYRLRKWQKRLDQSRERRMQKALKELEKLVNSLKLPESVLEESSRLYEKALKAEIVQGRKIESVAASLVYIVARNQSVPRTLSEIASEADLSERELGKTYRYVARELDLRIVPVNPEDLVSRFAEELNVYGETRAEAREIIKEAKEKGILAGRSPDGVVASAFYIASTLIGDKVTQKEIADTAKVTEVTVRKGYQHLAEALELEQEMEN